MGTSPARKTFSQLEAFAQQLSISGLNLGWEVQSDSTNVSTSSSYTKSGRNQVTVKLNVGVVTGGGGELVSWEDHMWGNHTDRYF